jgi:SAM-dependent methyltransferase
MTAYNFDRVSHEYDQTRGLPSDVPERIARWVLSRLPADPVITELGVGTGRIGLPFIAAGVRYTGLDIAEAMMAKLTAKLGGDLRRAQLIRHDVTQPLPVPDGSQDAVLAVNILHLVDAIQVLHNVRRALKPGGALVWGFEEADPDNPHRMLRERFQAEAAALGHRVRDYHVQHGRQQLAEWGAHATRHIVATWGAHESLQAHLDRLRGRVHSFCWGMTDEQIRIVTERTTAWALETFGDLSEPRIYERRFVIDWYVLGGA